MSTAVVAECKNGPAPRQTNYVYECKQCHSALVVFVDDKDATFIHKRHVSLATISFLHPQLTHRVRYQN